MAEGGGELLGKLQVVDCDGQFLTNQLETFVRDTDLGSKKSGDYQVVAIMGPQSSGKSTLLNHVFGTSFVMMDALAGRSQTTKGIWLSKANKVSEPLTMVMDLEGNDGRERGEDDTNFERQIALFALAVADILLVNLWCHDIGREQGSGKPLLKTIFQVNLKLFAPDPNRKRTVLLFVIRDKSKTPLNKLVEVLEDDLHKMWDTITKPPAYQESKISDFFDIQYAAMSHYEEKHEDFLIDAGMLRRRFTPDADDTLIRPNDHLPGAAFVLSVHSIWDTIRQQKDLNLPAHKVMVANIRCAEIARDQLEAFKSDQAWQALEAEATGSTAAPVGSPAPGSSPGPAADGAAALPALVSHFNTRLTQLMDSCLAGYEEEAMYFDSHVRGEKLEELTAKLVDTVQPAVTEQTRSLQALHLQALHKELLVALMDQRQQPHASTPGISTPGAAAAAGAGGPVQFVSLAASVRTAALAAYKKAFNEHLRMERRGWDGKEAVAAFEMAADELLARVRAERMQEGLQAAVKKLSASLSGPVTNLLDTCPTGLWPKLHALTQSAAANTATSLLQALSGFGLSEAEQAQLRQQVEQAAETRMEGHVREAALTRLSRMKDRFTELFTLDASKAPRLWRPHENIPAIATQARLAAAQLLSQVAVMRPAEAAGGSANGEVAAAPGSVDAVEAAIMRLAHADLAGSGGDGAANGSTDESAVVTATGGMDVLSITEWPGVPEAQVLVQPHEVRTTWRDFMSASNALIQQAQAAQQASRAAANRAPPLWAILAILVLGWNELMAVLWNPVYLVLGGLVILFGRSLWQELDVESEMAKGSLPGTLSLMSKVGPATRTVVTRTRDALQGFVQNPGEALENVRHLVQELELQPNLEATPVQPQRAATTPRQHVVGEGAGGHAARTLSSNSTSAAAEAAGAAAGNVSASGLNRRRQGAPVGDL